MKKISLGSLLKIRKIIPSLGFCAFLIIFSMTGGITFAQDVSSISTNLITYYTVTSSSVPLAWEDNFDIIWGSTFEETIPSTSTGLITYYTVTASSVPLVRENNSINENKFNIERKLTSATSWVGAWSTQITTTNSTNYTETPATKAASYDYRVQACLKGIECSDWDYFDEFILNDFVELSQTTTITPALESSVSSTTTSKTPDTITTKTPLSTQTQTTSTLPSTTSTAGKVTQTGVLENVSKIISPAIPATVTTTTNEFSSKTQDLGLIIEKLQTTEGDIKEQLSKIEEGDLLYKDSNKDGISDYDSIYVYNINPTKPSPVSSYEGKSINASEKILLGFDPTQSKIVKINIEQPLESTAFVVSSYKVKEVMLTEKKEVILKGQALPNSFITLYIYSTPIIVTVKTDSKGEWQYVLDKELENGDHTVYTATVNNSGNIIAKSSPYLFTKTAEAATLKDVPMMETSVDANKPGLLEGNNIYVIIVFVAIVIIVVLILVGLISKRKEQIEEINKNDSQNNRKI